MFTKYKTTFFSALLASVVHLMLGTILLVYWHIANQRISSVHPQIQIINSYLYHDVVKPSQIKQADLTPVIEHRSQLAITQPPPKHVKQLERKSQAQLAQFDHAQQIQSNEQTNNLLLAILHTAIQQHQQYPTSAVQLQRQGSAVVKFTLLPDGAVQDLSVIKSSGTTSLDQAATAAVIAAAPFVGVDNYVKKPQVFNISIAFKLNLAEG